MIRIDSRWGKRVVSAVIIAAVAYFVSHSIGRNYAELATYEYSVSVVPLALSFGILIVHFLFAPLMWQMVLRGLNQRLPFRKCFGILYVAQLGKYVPGKVLSYLGITYLAKREGVDEKRAFLSAVALQALMILGSVYAFVASLVFWETYPLGHRLAAVLFVVGTGFLFVRSNITNSALNFLLRRVLKEDVGAAFNSKFTSQVLLLLIPNWICYGVAYYFLINSLHHIGGVDAAKFTGFYAISWVLGYLCFILPGGIGVREGVQVYLLNLFVPLPVAIMIAVASRLWLTAGEIAVALISLGLMKSVPRLEEAV